MTRQRLLGDWLAFYSKMELPEALTFIEDRLRMLKKGMMKLQHQRANWRLRAFMGMSYGVHQQCRSVLSRPHRS